MTNCRLKKGRAPVARVKSVWIGNADKNQLGDLLEELQKILPGTKFQHEKFAAGAAQAFQFYEKFALPHQREMEVRARKFERLQKAASEYREAIEGLDGGSWGELSERYFLDTRKFEPSDDNLVVDRQLQKARADIGELKNSGDIAGRAASAAGALLTQKICAVSESRTDPAVRTLVKDIAVAYDRVFGERPSPAKQGIFVRTLRAILQTANVTMPEEKALTTILRDADLIGTPPKRGRKARKENTA
ncbi:hypothetical protein WOC76_04375 [Methylocystis sp. IM3]|uniref:hypothetical protein n=1 Tax=Methylocystis sp. IM3 TaxID=3136722 RepID=UPI00311919AA